MFTSGLQVALLLQALDDLPGPAQRFVINTHHHEDHRGLSAPLAERGAVLLAHEATREAMSRTVFIQELGQAMTAAPHEALPTLVTAGDPTLHLGQRRVELLQLAGPQAVVLPGHGPPSDRATLAAYREVLVGLQQRVAAVLVDLDLGDEAALAFLDAAGAWEPAQVQQGDGEPAGR